MAVHGRCLTEGLTNQTYCFSFILSTGRSPLSLLLPSQINQGYCRVQYQPSHLGLTATGLGY
eukprot:10044625-Karenia_brevis.AAC.1